ncbi:MAG: hypothetical protein AAGG02_18365 [Cyanobacteria bacterium P01_H01_bin.15]
MESPKFCYDVLAAEVRMLVIWETEHMHVLDSHEAIVNWISSSGLRPFLNMLKTEAEREAFI